MRIRELKVVYASSKNKPNLKSITNPKDIFNIISPVLKGESQENFLVLCLNVRNKLNGYFLVSKGTVDETLVHPRDVFKSAIITNSSSVVLVHNHPGETLRPSREDVATTNRLIETGRIIGIPVLDHIIVNDENYLSLKEEGYI